MKSNRIYRNNWLQIFKGWGFQLSLRAGYDQPEPQLLIHLIWGQIFIDLPWNVAGLWNGDTFNGPSYELYWSKDDPAIVFRWGKGKHHFYYMPWALNWYRTSMMLKDGTWEHEKGRDRKNFWRDEWKEKLYTEQHPYTYTLQNGTVQHRTATVTVCEREWRQRWLPFTGLFAFIRKTIEVEFDDEVGERTGSWKGGTVGCGYDMKPGETPLDTLRRMELERVFD